MGNNESFFQGLTNSDVFFPISLVEEFINEIHSGIMFLNKQDGDFYAIKYANPSLIEMLGYESDNAGKLSGSFFDFVYSADLDVVGSVFKKTADGKTHGDSYRLINADGLPIWFSAKHRQITIQNQQYIYIVFSDLKSVMSLQFQNQLIESNDNIQDTIDSVPAGIAIFTFIDNELKKTVVNQSFVKFCDEMGQFLDGQKRHWEKSTLSGLLTKNLYAFTLEEDVLLVKAMLADSHTGKQTSCVYRMRGSTEGRTVWLKSYCCSKMISDHIRKYYVTFENNSREIENAHSLKRSHEILLDMSTHDSLTGLLNRYSCDRVMESAKTDPLRNTGIIFTDINGLKNINDTLGHKYGDELILTYSKILKTHFDENCIFRISGDEFVIIVKDVTEKQFMYFISEFTEDVEAEDNIASIGYIWEETIYDFSSLLGKAEQLMYVQKQNYYANKKNIDSKHRPKMLNQLIEHLNSNRYQLFLQPKADIESSTIYGAEALVRKFDADGKMIFPGDFIPQLEKMKLIPNLDFFMLEEACRFLKQWEEEGRNPLRISVNMSRVTLAENDFIEKIVSICDKYKTNRDNLEFEITESTETMHQHKLISEVAQLKKLGFYVSLDDMGADYSGLNMLLIDGIDVVKLDRSFILNMSSEKGTKLIKHIINMSHDLGISCIAEGVETEAQRLALLDMGCESYQGYFLSKPISKRDFITLYDNLSK